MTSPKPQDPIMPDPGTTPQAFSAVTSGHTPGPWRLTSDAGHPTNARITSTARRHVAKVYAEHAGPDPICEANARLIAAAPELLRALVEITAACEEDCTGPTTDDCADDESVGGGEGGDMALTFGAIRRAQAAIAKATTPPLHPGTPDEINGRSG